MADMDDRREYDEPVGFAFCPTCGGTLEYDDTSFLEDGYQWRCPGCQDNFMACPVPLSRSYYGNWRHIWQCRRRSKPKAIPAEAARRRGL